MSKPQHALHWFEIPVRDLERAVAFYTQVCNQPLKRETMDGFQMAMFPSSEDGVGGCLWGDPEGKPSTEGSTVYLNAEPSVEAALGRVEKAGGRVIVPRTALPEGMGYFALFIDSEGNKVGLHALN